MKPIALNGNEFNRKGHKEDAKIAKIFLCGPL